MGDELRAHLATVGATALAGSGASAASLPGLTGDEPHVSFLASVLGRATTGTDGQVVSLDARRLRSVA